MEHELNASVARSFFGRFANLRQIQQAAITPILRGENVLLLSSTGSGKTEAVVAPIVSRYLDFFADTAGTVCVYVTPTRALANDLRSRLSQPLDELNVRLGIRHGDTKETHKEKKPHLLITTPESLDVLLCQSVPYLRTVQALIVDEIHLLYNTQRGFQLSVLFNRLEQHCGRKIQWCGLSATVASADMICKFLFPAAKPPVVITDPFRRELRSHVRLTTDRESLKNIFRQLLEADTHKLLIFANSRRECESVAATARKLAPLEHSTFVHYSSLSQEVRHTTEKGFWTAGTAACVATSTLELGIDIGDVDAVVLHGPTVTLDSFLQRMGRGNRRTEFNNVVCLTRLDSRRPHVESLAHHALLNLAEKGFIEGCDPARIYGAAVQQVFSILASKKGAYTRVVDFLAAFDGHSHLSRQTLEHLLDHLASIGFLQQHGFQNRFGAAEPFYVVWDSRMIWGNFPVGAEDVRVMFKSQELGTIPAFNLLRLTPNSVFRFGGKLWRVTELSREGIQVLPATRTSSAIDISYGGAGLGFSPQVLEEIHRMLSTQDIPRGRMTKGDEVNLMAWVRSLSDSFGSSRIPECGSNGCRWYITLAGAYINRALAILTGQPRVDCDDFTIRCTVPISFSHLPKRLECVRDVIGPNFSPEAERTIFQDMLPVEIQNEELYDQIVKNPATQRIWERLTRSVAEACTITNLSEFEPPPPRAYSTR
jgi:ATP-dependent Lhr-like helicase